jgi:hypothetical protein
LKGHFYFNTCKLHIVLHLPQCSPKDFRIHQIFSNSYQIALFEQIILNFPIHTLLIAHIDCCLE